MYIQGCMIAEEIRIAILDGGHIGMPSELIPHGWLSTKSEVQKDLWPYWSFGDEITITDGIANKAGE